MISFKRDGTKVVADMETGDAEVPAIRFDWETGRNLYAGLLADRLRDLLTGRLKAIRLEAYLEGYRDGRAKLAKTNCFSGSL